MTDVAELLRSEAALQEEARAVRSALGLDESLAAIGRAVTVGSVALRVMAARDIDITVVVEDLGRATPTIARFASEMIRDELVRDVLIRDDSGAWNTDPNYPDGVYVKLTCRGHAGTMWTVDIWFVDEPDRQPDLEHLRTLAPRLDRTARASILAIKRHLIDHPLATPVPSITVYEAVLSGAARTPDEFIAHRGSPGA